MKQNELECPVDETRLNESKVRVIAGLVLITALTYLLTGWVLLPLLLAVDFALRGFGLAVYSPLGYIADHIVTSLQLPYKAANGAPKRFAARIGFGFGVLITALHVAGVSALLPTLVLALFAGLESLAGFCAGCLAYTYYVRLERNLSAR